MNITAVIPVRGREPLFTRSVRRLLDKGVKVVAVVSTQEEKRLVDWAGGYAERVSRMELGRKWNRGYEIARESHPDAVLHIGSDDWLADDYLDTVGPWLGDYEIVGVADYYFTHFEFKIHRRWDGYDLSSAPVKVGVCYWEGYDIEKYPHRKDEPVGGGRMISAEFLDMIGWQPFDKRSIKNLDYEMMCKCREKGCYSKALKGETKAISITTNLWPCKNGYYKMSSQSKELKEDFLKKHFPEVYEVWYQ